MTPVPLPTAFKVGIAFIHGNFFRQVHALETGEGAGLLQCQRFIDILPRHQAPVLGALLAEKVDGGNGGAHATVVGDRMRVAWFPEHGTVGGFSRELDGKVLEVSEIDVYGNTPRGKLQRIDMFSEVYWMVWSHFHPGARLLD